MREQRTIGRPFTAEIEIYNACKYTATLKDLEDVKKVRYEVESWEIVNGKDAEEIEAETDGTCIDDNHEYLVLHLTDGDTATFRNSYCDMFRVR